MFYRLRKGMFKAKHEDEMEMDRESKKKTK